MALTIRNYHWILLIAVLSFVTFQWFSITISSDNRHRLNSVKDEHFPILENIDKNITRVEKIKDLYLQAVLIGETDLIEQAKTLTDTTKNSLNALKTAHPYLQLTINELQLQLDNYSEISSNTAMRMINGEELQDSQHNVENMNHHLDRLQKMISDFRNNSYENFIGTLSRSEQSASQLHYLGIALGLMNLVFMGILGYFVRRNDRMMNIIESQNQNLEARVEQRTMELKQAQNELFESEKMASLGRLVSGVAHEINTPLGVSITAASHLTEEVKAFNRSLEAGSLRKSTLQHFSVQVNEGMDILQANLQRASNLIKNFKQVAVDQSVEEVRKIDLSEYFKEVLSSLRPKWKHTKVSVVTDFPDELEVTTYPGALAQILTNLITNSIKHGYDEGTAAGEISISVQPEGNSLVIIYSDYGKGMSAENLKKVFDPFFTTKRGEGGTGLGMHIVYNLVTQKLRGRIDCESEPGEGCHVTITLPRSIEA